MDKQSVAVLGLHRSGSSALSGALHRLGINMGFRGMLGAGPSNPGGHYEDVEFLLLNDKVVGDWRDPSIHDEIPEIWRHTYECIVADRTHNCEWWGMKDPRLAFTLPYILPYMPDPKIVYIKRDLDKSVASLAKREGIGTSQAEDIQYRYGAAIRERIVETTCPVIDVSFEALVYSPGAVLSEVMVQLGIGSTDENVFRQAVKWIDKGKVTVR